MAMRDPAKSYWGFTKGHLNPGEKSLEAAKREVKEEVGIDAEVIAKIGDSRYIFTLNSEKIFKVVTMFLMESKTAEIKIQAEEIQEAKWVDKDEVLNLLSFSNDRTLFRKALEVLNGH